MLRRTAIHLVPLVAFVLCAARASAATPFQRALDLQGITFKITCENDSSLPTLTVVPAGLKLKNSPIVRQVDGSVVGADAADLNADGSPEVYVYVQSAGSGSYGSVVAYSANRRTSLSEIYLPPITEHPAAAAGYAGHDEFSVVGTALVRRFPLYRENDTNASPTGRTRTIHYTLVPGEAGWILRVDKTVEE